jgi:tRNA pseudouridine55 synthase
MARRKKGRPVHGIITVDKPTGRSSNHVLQQVKRLFNAQKAGHTGSLDPLATGVLPICLGDATRISSYLLDSDKSYLVRCKLGVVTDSGDSDGEIIAENPVPEIEQQQLLDLLQQFIGEQEQVPPMYSALKLNGQPLYKLARQGIEVERKARRINIYDIQFVDMTTDTITLEVSCSKGTYIRSLIEDIGSQLGCGAHVIMLRRTQAAGFKIETAITIDDLVSIAEQGLDALDALLSSSESALESWASIDLDEQQTVAMLHGQVIKTDTVLEPQLVKLFSQNKQFIGIAELQVDNSLAPKRIFSSQQQGVVQ